MKRIIFFCITFSICAMARVSLQLDRERVESGKSFGLQLIIPLQELPENRSDLQLNVTNGFTLLAVDSADQVIRPQPDFDDVFNSFFGGGHAPAYKARVYTFNLRAPKKTGKLQVGQIFLTYNGQKQNLTGDISIPVQRAFADEALTVSLTPSKRSVYEGEQFFVTLGFHTYEHFEGGLQATDMSTGNDFIVHRNNLSDLKFEPVENNRRELKASSKFAWLSPTKSGDLKIPAFKFKYTKRGEPKIVEENKQVGGMSFHSRSVKQESIEAEAQSPTVTINVKPLPEKGKPENFSGMVGNYNFKAEFDRTSLKVGDALTLQIDIFGDGTPGTITDPKIPDFAEFRAVPPESKISKKIKGNKVITTKSIRLFLYPKHKGVFQIPEISYSWFNPTKKKYETAQAGPWEIQVEKGDMAATSNSVSFQNTAVQTVSKQEIETLGSDIRFLKTVPNKNVQKPLYNSVWYWAFVLSAIVFYGLFLFGKKIRQKKLGNASLMRQSKAFKNYRVNVAKAETAAKNNKQNEFYAALETALIDFASDKTNAEFRGMLQERRKAALEKWGATAAQIQDFEMWLELFSAGRFAPQAADKPTEQTLQEFKQFVNSLEKLK